MSDDSEYWDAPSRDQLIAQLDSLLAKGRSKSDGGWAPVAEGDIDELNNFFYDVVRALYERDPDGGLPIEVTLTDRTKYRRPAAWITAPYVHKTRSDADIRQLVGAAGSLMSVASDLVKSAGWALSDREKEGVKNDRT